MTSIDLLVPGYRILETLYTGTRTLVYRAIQESDAAAVILKLLRNPNPRFQEVVQFRNQYVITQNLSWSGVVRPYSLQSRHGRYVLVMEDVGGVSLKDYIATRSLSLAEILTIAIQLSDILHGLYQNRVIHKDIKPANILIIPDSQQVKLIDFSIASLLPKEMQEVQSIHALEGTLAYLSPEQTGRMNRGIDYRSDFYSLGITLFELLTGQLPFTATDPVELVHCHLAKQPPAVRSLNPAIPPVVAEIVAKLMAKNAEDRYQSALGLKYDLEVCLQQWQKTGQVDVFPLGQRDQSNRFLIPEKLYGRETEVESLLQAFERVAAGTTELMLVTGFSGIGKTVVVNEVHKPIVHRRGYFIKGKFDQFQRSIPLSAFVHAFRDLMQQLLSESDAQLQTWKTKILAALGESGQLLIEVIPELEQLIGPQPPVPELSGTAAQHRFEHLFQKFIQVFTTPDHPLVIFLDDLQWADVASLKLLQLLLTDTGYLLLIGAYRDNEVSPIHPLAQMVARWKNMGVTLQTIALAPLQLPDITQLIADTLSCSSVLAQPLATLTYQKTQGNPFFTTQFLKALHEAGQIGFEASLGYWCCDMAQIQAQSLTEDVVEFMMTQLQKLPETTQEILKLAACIGNQFDLDTLALVAELSVEETMTALWPALQEGLILPITQTYKFFQLPDTTVGETPPHPTVPYRFSHDRVQQAAYALIPETQKQMTHFKLGQRLLWGTSHEARSDKLFEILYQLNQDNSLITDPIEQYQLAELNLAAGRKAKLATAYLSAFNYFITGIQLLAESCWQEQYALTLQLYTEATEAAFLSSQPDVVGHWANPVIQHARTILDTIKVYEVQIEVYTAQGRLRDALEIALELLAKFKVTFPSDPTTEDIAAALQRAASSLQQRSEAELLNLPDMTDPQALATLRILAKVTPSAFIAAPMLSPLIICEQLVISVTFGNAPASAYAYSLYGLLLCGLVGDLEAGFAFGQLSLQVLERFKQSEYQARTWFIVNGFIAHWKRHARETLEPLKLTYVNAVETGDLVFAGYCAYLYGANAFYLGHDLMALEPEMVVYRDALQQIHQQVPDHYNELNHRTVWALQTPSSSHDLDLDLLTLFQETGDRTGLGYLFLNQAMYGYWFEAIEPALDHIEQAKSYADASMGMFNIPLLHFYDSLIQLAAYPTTPAEEQPLRLEQVAANQAKMQHWATHAPMNYQHKYDLVEAERSRVLGDRAAAIDAYDRAIAGAKANGYLQEEALANELAAKFYQVWGKDRIAQAYLLEAYAAYTRWGAGAKAVDLERRYPDLLADVLQSSPPMLTPSTTIVAANTLASASELRVSSSSLSASDALDLATVLKVSRALSSEIHLDRLLSTLLQVVLENAGANGCALILREEKTWVVAAIATVNDLGAYTMTLTSTPLNTSHTVVPIALINIVKHTHKSAMIFDVTSHPVLAADPYVQAHQPKSVFALPIIQQGKLIAILYLENTLTVGAFTSDRVQLLHLLCTQAAISLENARLYQHLQTHAQQVEESLEKLQLSDARYRYLATATSQIIWLASPSGENLDTVHWQAYTGQSEAEVKGTGWLSALHPDDIEPTTQAWLQAVEAKSLYETEYRIRGRDGVYRYFAVRGVPLLAEDGSVKEWIGTCTDIDARKRAENELRHKSEVLEQTLQELQMMQLQLVQNEKMSALGNLVAGVAHEINNPVGFLSGNIQPAIDYTTDLFGLLDLYQQQFPDPGPDILDEIDAIDLAYLREDLPKLIQSMQTGVERIRNISTSLRTFSRADLDYKVPFNLHEGIESTLLILKHRLKANESRLAIEVLTEYGELPLVKCFPGQLNQVFMNLLANAIDAVEESNQGKTRAEIQASPNRITVRTQHCGNQVMVEIQDNGIGMTEATKAKIFDHRFTTKAVGKGTGLGLAIARQIVEEVHGGQITVTSNKGEGTTFRILLPLAQPERDQSEGQGVSHSIQT